MSLKTIARPTRSSIEYNADAAGKDEMTGVRREAAGPRDYGVTVARVAAITYGKPARDPVMLQSGITRARDDGLSRRAGAGDDGRGLDRDRGPIAAGLPTAQDSRGW